MKKIFVTGIAGTGKSTIANELRNKGMQVIDLDHVPGLCSWVNLKTNEKIDISNASNPNNDFIDQHDYKCDIGVLKGMLNQLDDTVVVFGSVGDNSELLPLFDKTFLLQCSPKVLIERLKTRNTNNFGKDQAVQQRMLDWSKIFDKLMLTAGAISINTDVPLKTVVSKLVDKIDN